MIDLTGIQHHPAIEEIVQVLCSRTQNTDGGFFRAEVAYFLGKIAGSMRATLVTKDRGEIPVNIYALALAKSGHGKGHSVNIMEDKFISGFRKRFVEHTLPVIAEKHLWDLANERAIRNNTEPDEEFEKVEKEYRGTGAYPFTFDSGSVPALKQIRHKLLMANCGSVNYQVDEIGSNLMESSDLLVAFLELYDQGLIKDKITKNSSENQRNESIEGKTPTNMLLFGTPSKLFDGGKTEDLFYSFLETGYARRCIYGWGVDSEANHLELTPEEVYRQLINPKNDSIINKWSEYFTGLANEQYYGWKITVEDDVGIKLIEYKMNCEKLVATLPEHAEIQKAEISHRYYKALKIAGAYAFIDQSVIVTMEHLLQAILLVEESGEAFKAILNREKAYVRLYKYLVDIGTEVTHADLHDALPFYKSSAAARNEILTLARAHAYKQHAIIRTRYEDNIELISAESLKETNLDEMILAYSNHFAYNYEGDKAPFDQLKIALTHEDLHWTNHQFKGGHRAEENVIPGFNMVVLDVDEGTNLIAARELLADYKYIIYTTKRHTVEQNRFRLILPLNYELSLDSEEYAEFMQNVCLWLPFAVDTSANQRSRKWLSNPDAEYYFNEEGELLDALNFIPRTSKNEQYIKQYAQVESLDNLERWFAQRMTTGNRNNQMIKYALALLDSGFDLQSISDQVHSFNKKLGNSLPPAEIDATVMRTVAKRMSVK